MNLRDVLRSGFALQKIGLDLCTSQLITGNSLRVELYARGGGGGSRDSREVVILSLDEPITNDMTFILSVRFSEEMVNNLLLSEVVPMKASDIRHRNYGIYFNDQRSVVCEG